MQINTQHCPMFCTLLIQLGLYSARMKGLTRLQRTLKTHLLLRNDNKKNTLQNQY